MKISLLIHLHCILNDQVCGIEINLQNIQNNVEEMD